MSWVNLCGKWKKYTFNSKLLLYLLCVYYAFFSARQLSHPHIVTFYGTNLQHGPNGTNVMIVLELCSCTLRSHVMSHPEKAPARLSSQADKKKVLGWALNILDALQYIHGEEFVHGDLKLDNILVSWWYYQYFQIPLQFVFVMQIFPLNRWETDKFSNLARQKINISY